MEKNDDKQFLLQVWETLKGEEIQYLENFTKTISYFATIILALISGAFLILKDVKDLNFQIIGLIVLGLTIMITSYIGGTILTAIQARRLDCITELAKLEDILGLNSKSNYSAISYWKDEGIMSTRSVEVRSGFENSGEFVKFFMRKGRIHRGRLSIYLLGSIGALFILYGIFLLFK